jgi:hypothetical protein
MKCSFCDAEVEKDSSMCRSCESALLYGFYKGGDRK